MTTDVTTQSIAEKLKLKIVPLALVVGGVALVSASGFLFFSSTIKTTTRQQTAKPSPTAFELHATFVTAATNYLITAPFSRDTKFPDLKTAAEQRQAAMAKLLITDPKKFLELALSAGDRDMLPADVQTLVENEGDFTGRLVIDHADNFTTKTSTEQYALSSTVDGKQTLTPVYFSATPPANLIGAEVTIHGSKLNGNLAISADSGAIEAAGPAATTAVSGQKKVAVILFNFQNDQSEPFTTESARQAIFAGSTSANAYYQEVSFGQVSLIGKNSPGGDVYGWNTIPFANSPCIYTVWADAANQIIGSAALQGYDYYVYEFPSTSACAFSGRATVSGTAVYMNGINDGSYITHEIGHVFGTDHANIRSCTSGGQKVFLSSTCSNGEYGDVFDVMGQASSRHHMSAYRKGFFNWIDPANTVDVAASGTFSITPIEFSGLGIKALRIPRTFVEGVPTEYLYLEYRQPDPPLDAFTPSDPVVNGVSIRLAPAYQSPTTNRFSYLLDATPGSSPLDDFRDGALAAGRTVDDTANGISITTDSVSAASASVIVSLTCLPKNPSVRLTTVPLPWMQPGTDVTFTLTVTNNNTPKCVSGPFTVSASLPAGWTMQPVPTLTLTPNVPVQVPITVSIPAAADGYHNTTFTLWSDANPTYFGTSLTAFRIDTTPPVVSITQPANESTLPTSGMVTIASFSTDNGSQIQYRSLAIDGAVVVECTNSVAFPCTYDWSMTGVSAGPHTIVATTKDYANNVSTHTITVYYPSGAGGAGGVRCGADQGLPPCLLETQ